MFEALQKATPNNKYKVEWVELDVGLFEAQVRKWLVQLDSSSLFSGPAKADRIALAKEFLQVLYIYKHLLADNSTYGADSRNARLVQSKIDKYSLMYRTMFKSDLARPVPEIPPQLVTLTNELSANGAKRDLLAKKKQVIRFWLKGVRNFNPHLDGVSLKLQYMGNADAATVRLFLDVIMKDAYKIMQMPDPRPWLKTKGEVESGGKASSEVVWTDEEFKKAVKAEASASYGVKASGECVIEFTGIKAELKAEAFAGAMAKAEGSAEWSRFKGVEVKGSVEAMIGVKIKAEAKLDVADIFLLEASAEAFAGAMAKGEVEIIARVDGVAVKLEAEAFAGAKIKGKAGMSLKVCGYDIIKGEAEGYLSAGIGASFKLEMEASAFGGAKIGIEAGATVGLGAGGGAKFTVYADNLPRVANAIFVGAYYTILNEGQKKYAWQEYFRGLEDNELLFKKADELIDQVMAQCFQDHQRIFASMQAYQQLQALTAWKTRGNLNGALPQVVAAPQARR